MCMHCVRLGSIHRVRGAQGRRRTSGSGRWPRGALALNDALHKVTLSGSQRGKVEQFLAVPTEAETCGPVIHDRDGLVFVCVQHPGENGAFTAQRSYFPDYIAPGTQAGDRWGGPRPSVVQVYRP